MDGQQVKAEPDVRTGDCPLCMWGGPGHSAPFAGHEPEQEREAG